MSSLLFYITKSRDQTKNKKQDGSRLTAVLRRLFVMIFSATGSKMVTLSRRGLLGSFWPVGWYSFMLNNVNCRHLNFLHCNNLDLNFDFVTRNLLEQNVSNGIDELASGLTGVDHEPVSELHRLRASSTELA